jgi:hypothetical protein
MTAYDQIDLRSFPPRWRRFLLVLLLAALPLTACGGVRNRECEPCANAEDCEIGLFCQIFRDGSGNPVNLCADANLNTTCLAD